MASGGALARKQLVVECTNRGLGNNCFKLNCHLTPNACHFNKPFHILLSFRKPNSCEGLQPACSQNCHSQHLKWLRHRRFLQIPGSNLAGSTPCLTGERQTRPRRLVDRPSNLGSWAQLPMAVLLASAYSMRPELCNKHQVAILETMGKNGTSSQRWLHCRSRTGCPASQSSASGRTTPQTAARALTKSIASIGKNLEECMPSSCEIHQAHRQLCETSPWTTTGNTSQESTQKQLSHKFCRHNTLNSATLFQKVWPLRTGHCVPPSKSRDN